MSKHSDDLIDDSEKKDEIINIPKEVTTNTEEKKKAELIFKPEVITDANEKKLIKKIDLRIIPLIVVVNILSFLDRVNIGNAKLAHLEHDLNLVGNEYNWALSIFFLGYILFEVPTNIISIKIKPSIWISTRMISWGSIVIAMAFVKNYSQLMATRFFLGTFQTGLYSGVIFYITKWYKRSERSYRISYFNAGIIISGAFNGLIAFSISSLNGKFGFNGWQWIFLIEGAITVIIAFFCYFLISDYPEITIWLTDDERKLAVDRLRIDTGHAYATPFDKHQITSAFKDFKVYVFTLIYFCVVAAIYAFTFFIPSIVNGMGFDDVISQLLSTPPFILGCISSIIITKISDNHKIRSPYLISGLLISIIGYSFLIVHGTSVALKYTCICVIGLGLFVSFPLIVAWAADNLAGETKRAVGFAIVNGGGNLGGILSAQIYKYSDAPAYISGHIVTVSLLIICVVLSIIQYCYLNRMNRYKLEDPKRFLKGSNADDATHLGDLHPSFTYIL
ncbi:major facilitator superfamily domain-containing protein [Gigaspora rosea]|uniref:Major facilitator superfamily domain-containing protein n=1 Tax=Gigaspora rosea TaxID=44941 RepID=A0A397W9G1_9GLOM|nr:major facilitator superfamily domain-containing protein [Gigaspora rosea]